MELKINRETIPSADCLYDGVQEQGVELDYILPDYYPDIFRLVRCEAIPTILGHTLSGDRLTYELRCDIRVLYCGEDGSVIRCIEQRRDFSKTVDLGRSCPSLSVKLIPKTDYVNFRAVNKRRLDVRGAVSVKITVTGESSQEVISDIFGMNMQLKKTPLKFAAKKLTAKKTAEISEETELAALQPDILNIISCRCFAGECEKKTVSGKLLAKGEAAVKLLYSCEKDGSGGVEPVELTFPYSQIIDIDGMDDSCECTVVPHVVSCDVSVSPDRDGNDRVIRCVIELRLECTAVRSASVMIGTDAYSTVYPCEITTADIVAEQLPAVYNEGFRHTAKLAEGSSVPAEVYSVWCTPKNINTRVGEDERSLVISGMLTYSMAAKDGSGMMIMPDKDEAFEETIPLDDLPKGCTVTALVSVRDTSYVISPEGVLTAKADISAKIMAYGCTGIKALTDVSVDDSQRKQRDGDYAVKLYFASENEELWDIAKRFSTGVAAVMEENELAGDRLEKGGMLLIPIVN